MASRDGQDVGLVEGAPQRGAAMARRPEGDPLGRVGRVRPSVVVRPEQRVQIDQVVGVGRLTGARAVAHARNGTRSGDSLAIARAVQAPTPAGRSSPATSRLASLYSAGFVHRARRRTATDDRAAVALAQPAEHWIVAPEVTGSSPVGHPNSQNTSMMSQDVGCRSGAPKNRAFSGVISTPIASVASRTTPASNGRAHMATRATGARHSPCRAPAARPLMPGFQWWQS